MFDWLIPLLIVVALLIWILDYLGLLDAMEALLGLLGLLAAAVVGTVRLAVRLARQLAASVTGKGTPGR